MSRINRYTKNYSRDKSVQNWHILVDEIEFQRTMHSIHFVVHFNDIIYIYSSQLNSYALLAIYYSIQ